MLVVVLPVFPGREIRTLVPSAFFFFATRLMVSLDLRDLPDQ